MPSRFRRTPTTTAYFILATLALISVLVWLSVHPTNALPQTYRNDTYHFSLNLPADYTVTDLPSVNAPIDIIEFGNSAGYIQLTIVPAGDDGSILTKDSILADYPYMADVPTEPVTITPSVIGFAIPGDEKRKDQMGGLWFEHAGYLLQFSAFDAGLDQLPLIARTIQLR